MKSSNEYEMKPSLKDDMESWNDAIKNCLRNFLDYRRHIAQAEDEAIFDAEFLELLKDDEAVAYIDYKMKILMQVFRESLREWFAQKGTSCLGVMLLLPKSPNEAFRKVVYHLFFSEDTIQDTPCVNTIKS